MIRLFGSKIYISIFVPLTVCVMCISPDAPLFFIALLGAVFHELAHIFAMKMFGAKIFRISVYPFGADINADMSAIAYRKEAAVYLSGPFISLVLALTAFLLFALYGGMYVLSFALSNSVFFFVNILPVKGLDGGRALWCILCAKCGVVCAERVYSFVTTLFFGVLCAMALALLFASGYNLSLLFVCAYLFLSEYVRQRLCL